MSLFQSVSQDVSVKTQSSVLKDPILYKNFRGDSLKEAELIFITEKPYSSKEVEMFKTFLFKSKVETKWALVSSVLIKPDNLKSNITKFYVRNRSPLESIIPEGAKIISMGRAIYAITQTDDIKEEDFIDYITHKTSFYSPDLKSYVFPIYEYFRWMGKDNFEYRWTIDQIVACKKFQAPSKRIRPHTYFNVEDTTKFFNDFKDPSLMAWDIETDSLDWRKASIGCITFAFNNYEGYFLRWKDIKKEELEKFLSNKKQILTNGKFDCKCLIKNGVDRDALHIDYDVWQMQHVWKEDNSHNSLKSGTWRHTLFGGYDRPLHTYIEQNKIKNYLDIPEPVMKPYAVEDSIETFAVFEEVKTLIEAMDKKYPLQNGWSLWKYFEEVVMGSVNTFLDVEIRGLHMNYEELQAMSEELQKEIEIIEEEVYTSFGKAKSDFNIYSTEQLATIIEERGWKIRHRGKSGHALTNEECLTEWKKEGYEEAGLLLKLREKTALMNTFVGREKENSGFYKYIYKEDNEYRIYPTILPMVADSGRSKHKKPNTANIPSHGKGASFVRRMFCPPSEDYLFLSADASGLQLRLGALESGDEAMRDVFINKGGDLHSMTAYTISGKSLFIKELPDGEVDVSKINKEGFRPLTLEDFFKYKGKSDILKQARFKAKGANFSLEFGAVEYTFKSQTIDAEWTEEDCDEFIEINHLEELKEKYYWECKEKSEKDQTVLTEEETNYWAKSMAVSKYIRDEFFTTYHGLEDWIKRTREKAKSQGFIRSIYGAFRRLPYLLYKGRDTDNSLYAGYLNICLNSPIQNEESVMMNSMMTTINIWLKENNMKSYFIGAVHDAVEMIVHRDELKDVCRKIKEIFEEDKPEYNGIPFEMEGNISDYWQTYKKDNWELWDMGHDWDRYL